MGMYDDINGEQIKVFGVPCWYGVKEGVSLMGGSLTHFETKDKVPYKTYWYDFTPNFIIIDINNYDNESILFHVIENGRVLGTFDYDSFDNKYFENTNKVLDYYANELSIRTKEAALRMREDREIMMNEVDTLQSPLWKLLRDSRDFHIEALKMKDVDKDKYDELESRAKQLLDEHSQKSKKIHEQIDKIRQSRMNIYFLENKNYKDEVLGMYIGAILQYGKSSTSQREAIDNMKEIILEMIKDEDLVSSYCDFQEISSKKFDNLIEKIKKL